jgi:hypothetical protein
VDSVVIDSRFNGPPNSGNGGYTCGLLARDIDGPAEVTLRMPPPLGVSLAVERDGERRLLVGGDGLVAEAIAVGPDRFVDPRRPVPPEEALEAVSGSFFLQEDLHPFPTCFVCGPKRDEGDGLRIFPAPVGDKEFAAVWTPPESAAGGDGTVPSEIVWSALDCPTSAPGMNAPGPDGEVLPIVLARLAVDVRAPVRAGADHVVTSWEISRDGRKREAGAALFDADSELLAVARALWIELKSA